jgi:CRP/FNR family transcriptional regulator
LSDSLRSLVAERIPALAEGGDELLQQLLDSAQVVELDRERFVFHAGDLCGAFLILLDGDVRVQLTAANGREVTLYRIGPGGSCILTTSCLLGREHYPAEAIAESNVQALAIPAASFQSALENSQSFRHYVFDGFSGRLANVIQRIEQIVFTSIDARLATVLLRLDDEGNRGVTHQEIAVELGTAREVVSRHLKRFEAEGWVRLGRRSISVADRERLAALAAPALGD